jgi:hypothetical protein
MWLILEGRGQHNFKTKDSDKKFMKRKDGMERNKSRT